VGTAKCVRCLAEEYPELKLYLMKNKDGYYAVTEKESGMAIFISPTEIDAINGTKRIVEKYGIDEVNIRTEKAKELVKIFKDVWHQHYLQWMEETNKNIQKLKL